MHIYFHLIERRNHNICIGLESFIYFRSENHTDGVLSWSSFINRRKNRNLHTQEGDARFLSSSKRETGTRVDSQPENLAVGVLNLNCFSKEGMTPRKSQLIQVKPDANNSFQLPNRAANFLISNTSRNIECVKTPSPKTKVLNSALQQ